MMDRCTCSIARMVLLVVVGVLSFGAAPGESARAERIYIDITEPNFEKLPIAIPGLKWQNSEDEDLALEMVETLENDLDISGGFRLVTSPFFPTDTQTMGVTEKEIDFERWSKFGAEFLVRGLYEIQGDFLKLEMRLFDTVSSDMVLGKVYNGRVKDSRAMIHRFADAMLEALTGQRGVFQTKIAFIQVEGKIKEIHVVDFDGENSVQITEDSSINLSPAWSPEGARIAYVSYIEGAPKLYILDLLSGSRKKLSGFNGLNIAPAWRPESDDLAATLSKDGDPDIYLLSSSGKVKRKLVDGWAIDVSPCWSPEGRRLAYVSNESGNPQVYIMDLGTGKKQRITFEGKYNTSPSWSPKGDWIAYSGLVEGNHDIFLVRPDGSERRRLTHGKGDNESPTWSPDGRMVAFSSTREGGRAAIWITMVNGTGLRRLTDSSGSQQLPEWSPYFERR